MRRFLTTLGVCLLATAAARANAQEALTIQQALELTAKLSPDVQSAQLRTLEAAAATASTKSAYQPQATLIVGGGYQTSNLQGVGLIFPGFPSRVGPYRTFNARPQVTQTVIDFSLLHQIRASRAQEAQHKADENTIREDTAIAVVQLYLQALAADSRAAAASARLVSAEALERQARDREQSGTGSKLDVARAVEQTEAERGYLIDARRESAELITMLLRTIGAGDRDPASIRLVAPQLANPDESRGEEALVAQAQAQRPEFESLRHRQEATALDLRAAAAQRLPRLSAVGDYGLAGAGPDRSLSTYTVGATLTVPLWTGRRIESEVTRVRVQQSQLQQEQRKLQLQVQQEIRAARIAVEAAKASQESARRGVAAAKESLELARLRYESGLATSVDTQVAQSQLALSEDTAIRTVYDLSLAQARLVKARGGDLNAAFR